MVVVSGECCFSVHKHGRPHSTPDTGTHREDCPVSGGNRDRGLGRGTITVGEPLLGFGSCSSGPPCSEREPTPNTSSLTTVTDPLGDVLRFIGEYENEYGQQHPAFFQGSYSQALSHAKSELKFMLVYLHCADHQDTPVFCRTTLSDPNLVEYVNNTMVFWGCSVTTAEGYRVSQALRENAYPFLALIVLRDGRMTVIGRLEGPSSPSQLTTQLQAFVRDNEAHLVVARAERQERELTAALRLQQDEDYQESLRADQEKERKKQQEREQAERIELEEREKEEDQQRQKDNIRRLKVEMVDNVPQEPEEGVDGVVHIVVKLPQGTRLERRFLKTESLSCLYYYIFCHPDSPDRFQVTTNFPRQVVPCEPTTSNPLPPTFEEFRLPPRSMLFVSDLDA
ncbi:FAS-associated factor 2 isoform X5 [Cherax quadricarinatus]|uniref:FAS-associated factor 2 isoform X5 n=1 Tax=Cherax quadricarinatus TaxID=27406 RepID=UPI002378FCFC|nr:FAS-associated factor 2-like isoform X5 [Cherax quadricarinatus]